MNGRVEFKTAGGIDVTEFNDNCIELTFYTSDIQLTREDIAELAARFPVRGGE